MAAKNTVEATLRTRYEDAITKGIGQTERALKQGMSAMQSGAASMAAGVGAAFTSATNWIGSFADNLRQRASQSESHFGRISLSAAAMATVLVAALLRVGQAMVAWVADLVKRSSEVLELRLAFESLTATMSENAAVIEGRLRTATEGLIGSADLLRNANRVLSADIPITAGRYAELVGNVFKLSKAAGVDGTQAINTLTDALIRGNARGFQTIGLQIEVKDAISAAAAAMGESTNKIETEAKLRAFYNQLLSATSAATQRNAAEYVSMADAVQKARVSWDEFLLRIGEAIGRSGVVAELLKRVSEALDNLTVKGLDVRKLALATNDFVISAIKGFAGVMEVLSVLSVVWDSVWGAVKLVVYSAGSMIASTLYLIQLGIVKVAEMAAELPGAVGRQFEATLPPLKTAANLLGAAVRTYSEGAKNAFAGYGQGAKKALEMAAGARHLAADLEKLAGVVREGGKGLRNHGNDAADAAAKLKELNQQLRAYRDLLLSLRGTNEYQAAYAAWQKDLDQINREITAKGAEWDARRDELRLAAAEKYFARIRDIGQKAAAEAAEAQRKLDEAMRPEAQDVSRMQGSVPPPVPEVRLTNQQQEALKLVDAFERLNGIKLDPFNQTLSVLQENVIQFAGMAGDAFASFFADLLSGQEGAGKKLLAAFMGMLGKMLVQQGVFLIQAGIAHVLLSSVFPYSLFLRASDGYKAIAWGAVLTAAGGALMGAASALAQTNEAGAGASFQQAAPRPTSSQTQVIQVGAAGRAQSAGEAAATKPSQPAEVVLRVESNDSHIVKVVEKNAGANGRLRLVMAHG